jgi:hypothetical protein
MRQHEALAASKFHQCIAANPIPAHGQQKSPVALRRNRALVKRV